jgi:hypothetical protein
MFEYLDVGGVESAFHQMDRRHLVHLCSGAAYSSGLCFLGWLSGISGIPENYMLRGLQNEPFAGSYWSIIVDTWDEIQPTIQARRRFGTPSGLIHFTEDFRSGVLNR